MFINPRTAIEKEWITGIQDADKQVQPNAIDFTLDQLYTIDSDVVFEISEESKVMRSGKELEVNHRGYWKLESGKVYDGMSKIHVNIPEGIAAMLIVRSTLNRNGLFVTSGLYDSGFNNYIGFAIHNRSGDAYIQQGTRVGQIIFVESDSAGLYTGSYNNNKGKHWAEG